MAKSGDVRVVPELGIRVEFRRTAAETGGEVLELDVVGRPRGFLTQAHVHERQTERHEMLEGVLRLPMGGVEHELHAGQSIEVPPGTPHRQLAGGDGPGHDRIEVRPAGSTEGFLERLAELSAAGQINRWGYPKPLAAAALVRDFGDEGHAVRPPLAVQKALAQALLRSSEWARARSGEYVFVDEWDVAAPQEAVFDALADARTYPRWWTPVYIGVDAEGPPALGRESRQHFKGRLPYHLRTRSRISRLERPHVVVGDVDGDLRGRGTWTLTPLGDGRTHVRFDWRVYADKPVLRLLTPVLRPAFRWNHDWAIARARRGLEPYARGLSGSPRG